MPIAFLFEMLLIPLGRGCGEELRATPVCPLTHSRFPAPGSFGVSFVVARQQCCACDDVSYHRKRVGGTSHSIKYFSNFDANCYHGELVKDSKYLR
eukprot:1169342-Amphidinium_carterae.1